MTTPDDRGAQLFDEGSRILAALWDDAAAMVRSTEAPDYHSPRETLAYAHVLLRDGDITRATRAIRSVLALQEMRPQDAHYGNFRWLLEEPCVRDLNAVEFMLDDLIALARDHASALPAGLMDEMRASIGLGLAEIDRLDVHPSYTNIALSDIANSVLGGELLGDARSVERGTRRFDEWIAFTAASGAPHEFNSPTYAAVDILRLAAVVAHTQDPQIALKARIAEERLWLHAAAYFHPGLAQLAGPHSRSYYDGWTGAGGYLKLVLWKLLGDDALRRETPYASRSREEGHVGIALAELHCPDYLERWLREKRYPFEACETTDAAHGVDIATYMTERYALGTMSRDYGAGEPRESWPGLNSLLLHVRRDAAPTYSSLCVRYIVNDKEPSDGGHGGADLWDEGRPLIAQHGNRAVVAYAPLPRVRPAHSYKLSVRLLGIGAGDEVWIGERRFDTGLSGGAKAPRVLAVAPCERVVIAVGDVYLALIPLAPSDMGSDAPIELRLAGESLTLDIYNYRGPAKTFWEYRSQTGPFYKGNVRNGFAIEVAERSEYLDLAAFREHIARAEITDTADSNREREITFASAGTGLSLRYSLRDMRLLERRLGGVAYNPPSARVGAGAGGPQFAQTAGPSLTLGRADLAVAAGPSWLFADDDAGRYVFTNPSNEAIPLRLVTPGAVIACDAFPFGRVDVDEVAGIVRVDAGRELGAISVTGPAVGRLFVGGREIALG